MASGSQIHFYMETQARVAVPGERDDITIYPSSQSPDSVHAGIRSILNIPATRVDVKINRVGGGYGGKTTRSPYVVVGCRRRRVETSPAGAAGDAARKRQRDGRPSPSPLQRIRGGDRGWRGRSRSEGAHHRDVDRLHVGRRRDLRLLVRGDGLHSVARRQRLHGAELSDVGRRRADQQGEQHRVPIDGPRAGDAGAGGCDRTRGLRHRHAARGSARQEPVSTGRADARSDRSSTTAISTRWARIRKLSDFDRRRAEVEYSTSRIAGEARYPR